MAEIYFDVDTALSEVPVNIFPLTDDTDFKTRETSVAYNAAGMDLVWNFVTTAGAYTQTAVTPTTSGTYDWTHQGDGMYTIEIPASGGASINNDTEGHGWFIGICTGVLPWRSPIFGFRSAALNNALIDGGDLLDVNVTHIADTAQTGRDIGTSVLLSSGTGTGQISLSSGAVTVGTNNDKTGYTASTVSDKTGYSLASSQTFNVTGNITGNLTGSVGSVTGAVGSVTGSVGSVTGNIGGNVTGSVASVTNIVNANITQISGDSVAADNAESFFDGTGYAGTNNVIPTVTNITNAVTAGTVSDKSGYALSTAGVTSVQTGLSTLTAQQVWEYTTRTLSAFGFNVTVGTNNDKTGYTLSVTPPTAATIADAVWDETLSGHLTSGSTGAALNATGAAGDPWETTLPGSYGAGTAGKIIGDNINATISSRSTLTASDVWGYTTRTLSSFGTLIADIWSYIARTITGGTITTNSDKAGYTISGTKQTLDALNDFNHSSDTVARVTLVDTCTTNTDMRGTNGAYTGTPPTVVQIRTEIDTNSTQLASIKAKTDNLPSGIKKGVALNNFVILMKDSTDHSSGKTGLTVTGTIRKDAGSFTSLSGTITEINYGLYSIDTISSDEMNADILTLRFTATGADDTFIEIKTV